MLFVAIVSNSCFENVFVAARVLAHHKLRARFLGSKYVAKAGRCFNSVISLQIDELSNYDRTCTIILVSSFPFYNISVHCASKINDGFLPESFTASRARNTEKIRRVLACLFAFCHRN